jgi:transposase
MDSSENSAILSSAASGAEEKAMIDQSQFGAVRVLFERGVPKKEIARQLELDIKTVRKYLTVSWRPQTRPSRRSSLERFREFLQARAPEVGFNAVVLYREVRALGYQGSYNALLDFVRPWRASADPVPTSRFETEPGKQAQVDWGSIGAWLGEHQVRVHIFTMILGFSRRIFARAYRHERISNLLDAHEQAFAHFGGRTETALYDNPRTIVLEKNDSTGEVVWNTTFKDRMDFYGLDVRLCRYYRAQTKGKVESGVKYVKRNALAGRRFRDLDELNDWLLEWCLTVADERVHGTTHERPSARFARAEATSLIAVDLRPAPPRERVVSRIVPSDTYVAVETNRYPVPIDWVGRTVQVRVASGEVLIERAGFETVRYERLAGKHQVARWEGDPRLWPRSSSVVTSPRPRLDPVYGEHLGHVEQRSLSEYAALAGEVTR